MMYLLDTNVISELRKQTSGKADKNVVAWARSVPADSLYISVITLMELEMGVLSIQRKYSRQGNLLRQWLDSQVIPAFSNRTLALDAPIAQCCASLHIPDPRSERDALIAATGIVNGMTVVTRNLADFEPTGVKTFNPWL
jgi:predicted nucleic acid-binding protein